MQSPYVPAPDQLFQDWLNNFSTLLSGAPATYGLVAGDAVIVAAAYAAWNAAFVAAITPATRTSVTIAQKDAERTSAEVIVRPYAVKISRNPAVLNGDKVDIGVNLPNTARTPVPPPTTQPSLSLVIATHFVHTLAYRDSSTPTTKAKPPGTVGMELWRTIAVSPQTDPSAATFIGVFTKSPNNVGYSAPDLGKNATYWGRWVTKSGPGGQAQVGSFSAPLAVVII